MHERQNITPAQIVMMTVGSALMYPYTILPVINAPPQNQDAWITALLTTVFIILLSIPVLILMNKFRGFNINRMTEIISGKIAGKIFLFAFIAFFIFCYVACMLIMLVFVRIYVLQKTPEWAVLLYMSIPIIYGAYKGAGLIGRISLFIVPPMLFLAVAFFLFALPDMDLQAIMPILADSTFLDISLGAFLTASRYSDILIFLVFSYFLIKKASINKAFFTGAGIFGLTFFLIVFPTLVILGPTVAQNEWNPYFVFVRQLEAYDFMRRLQSLNMLVWVPGSILKLLIYNYMASFILQNVFKTKSHKPFVFIVGALSFFAILMGIGNRTSTIEYLKSDELFPYIVLIVAFILPLILMIIYLARKKTIEEKLKRERASMKDEENGQNNGDNNKNESNNFENNKEQKASLAKTD